MAGQESLLFIIIPLFTGVMYRFSMDTIYLGGSAETPVTLDVPRTPALVDGIRGKALEFNGVDQYAEIHSDGLE